MIVVQSNAGRRLTGNIGRDVDLFDGLNELCRNHNVRTGELRAIGYLRDVRLASFHDASERFVEDEGSAPSAQCLSLLGNISMAPEGPSFHLQAILSIPRPDGTSDLRGGRLVAAKVVDLEFFVVALDDFGLVRAHGAQAAGGAGLAPWVRIEPRDPDAGAPASLGRPELVGGRLAPRPDETEPQYELRPGDVLDHPRLGSCVIHEVRDEDTVTVRIESGASRELRLSLFRLRLTGTQRGSRHFAVEIRRKT